MYQACRHIKPSGQRCKSPAMRDHAFCYFHARVHQQTKNTDPHKLSFPVPEDFAAIQESLARVFDSIVRGHADHKETAQILWGLQIAMQTIPRNPAPPADSVESVTLSSQGDELAPPLEVCPPSPEDGSTGKALPTPTGIHPDAASGDLASLVESIRAEVLGSK